MTNKGFLPMQSSRHDSKWASTLSVGMIIETFRALQPKDGAMQEPAHIKSDAPSPVFLTGALHGGVHRYCHAPLLWMGVTFCLSALWTMRCVRGRSRVRRRLRLRIGRVTANLRDECCICMDSMATEPVRRLPCRHVFHDACIRRWLRPHGSAHQCPLCKHSLLVVHDV